MITKLLEFFPALEVLIRHLYWKNKAGHQFVSSVNEFIGNLSKNKKEGTNSRPVEHGFTTVSSAIKDLGVEKGDTLIVHSSYIEMKHLGISASEINLELERIIGGKGNLVMPAIPLFRGEPRPLDRFDIRNYKSPTVYDVKKSRVWTGALPQALLKKPESLRSRNPLNTMVVSGFNADEIVRNDLFDSSQLPCGSNSVLANCLDFEAKILFLGVDEVHALTMIHVAEDLFEDTWPVKNWYRNRQFRIIDDGYAENVSLRERDPKWALFYAEKRFRRDLVKHGILKCVQVDGLTISLCESVELIEFLRSRSSSAYPYYIPKIFR